MGTLYIDKPELAYVHIPRTGMAMKKIIAEWMKPNFNVVDDDPWMINHPNLKMVHEHYPDAITFTVVRNPWQRLWSFYRKIKDEGYWLDWNGKRLQDLKPFNDWIADYVNPDVVFEFPRWFNKFTCQIDFIHYDNTWVDFILKAETLETDFKQIQNYLNCDKPIPNLSGYDHYEYRKYFNQCSKKLVEETFKRDIDFFNFEF